MSGYVAAGFGLPVVTLAAYTAWMLRRGRTLARSVADSGERR